MFASKHAIEGQSNVSNSALPCSQHAATLMGRRGRCDSTPGGQAPSRGSPRACLKVDGSADRDVMGLFGPPRLGARLRLRPVVKWLPRPGEDRRSHPVVRQMATSLVASAGAVVRRYMRWATEGTRWPVPVADGGRRGGQCRATTVGDGADGLCRWPTVGDGEAQSRWTTHDEFRGQCRWFRYDDHARWNLLWRCGV